MLPLRNRLTTLLVLSAYLAAHAFGALVHDSLHMHTQAGDCQHAHVHHHHGGHDHHDGHGHARSDSDFSQDGWSGLAEGHAHECVVCRVAGQPVVAPVAASFDLVADVCQPAPAHSTDLLTAPPARPTQARAPPLSA